MRVQVTGVPAHLKRTHRIVVLVTADESKALVEAAQTAGLPVSSWIRALVLERVNGATAAGLDRDDD